MSAPVRVAFEDLGESFGAALISAARTEPSSWLLVGPEGESSVPTERVAELLTGGYGIGAVIPGGANDTSATSSDLDLAVPPDLAVAQAGGGAPGEIAVQASVVIRADIDPRENDPMRVLATIFDELRAEGKRLVSEPTWFGRGPRRPLAGEPDVLRVMVIASTMASDSTDAESRSAWELVTDLARLSSHTEVTALSIERFRSQQDCGALRSIGARVIQGPVDWDALSVSHANRYSHVIVLPGAIRSGARYWVEVSQPLARKVLLLPRLPVRELDQLRWITPLDERAGLEFVKQLAEADLARWVEWAHFVWCERDADASFVSAAWPDRPVSVVPPAVRPRQGQGVRSGLVLVATDGHDVVVGNEDAAVRVLNEILPQLRWRDPNVSCTVVSDNPTPMLVEAAGRAGARFRPSSDLDEALLSARLMISAHGFGVGQPYALVTALATATPFIATPQGVGGLELGPLADLAVSGATEDIVARSWQLLTDDQRFETFAKRAATWLEARYSPKARNVALTNALASLGVDSQNLDRRWPDVPDVRLTRRQLGPRRVKVPIRPDSGPSALQQSSETGPDGDRDRYRLWVERYGPTPNALRAIREDLGGLAVRPNFSILMPVYNTDPAVLLAAVDSVRAQVYTGWELCVADDGSDRAETLALLSELEGDRSIRVVHLPGSSGIAGATNAALDLATGEYTTFLDHDDLLKPHALAQVARWLNSVSDLDVIYSDEDKVDSEGELYDPHPKPDWSPDQLMNHNYVCHLTVVRTALLRELGGLRTAFDGSQDHDLLLRLAEVTDRIAHIPEPLYTWRATAGSAAEVVDAKPYAIEASRRAISDALVRRGYEGRVDETETPGCFRARYEIPGEPHVSVIIPTRDRVELLERCLDSVITKSTYSNFDVVIVDNESTDPDTLDFFSRAPVRVIRYPFRFNYARMMNLAARSVECDALLFLNNDTEIITPSWIEAMLEHAMRPEVGAVGCRLFYPNGSVQHEGIMVGAWGGWAGNVDFGGFWNRGNLIRNVSAVTGACTMIRPGVYWRVGGNDERLQVAYNDVDICLRIRQAGYEVVYTPFAELFHYESASRSGYEHPEDGPLFGIRWRPKESVDPYYSPMLCDRRPFAIKL